MLFWGWERSNLYRRAHLSLPLLRFPTGLVSFTQLFMYISLILLSQKHNKQWWNSGGGWMGRGTKGCHDDKCCFSTSCQVGLLRHREDEVNCIRVPFLARWSELSRSWTWVLANHRSQIYLGDCHKSKPIFMCWLMQQSWQPRALERLVFGSKHALLCLTLAYTNMGESGGSHFCLMNYVSRVWKGRV